MTHCHDDDVLLQKHAAQIASSLKPHLPVVGGAAAASLIVILWGGLHREFGQKSGRTQASMKNIRPLASDSSAVSPMEPLAPQTPQVQARTPFLVTCCQPGRLNAHCK